MTSETRPFFGSFNTGDCCAMALTAATSILSESRRERERITPRPMPGKAVELLHSALMINNHMSVAPYLIERKVLSFQEGAGRLPTSYRCPLYSTGGNGLPVATRTLPSVQLKRSSGTASCSRVGLLNGRIIGRWTCFAISFTISSVNDFGLVEVPMSTWGFTSLMTESKLL